MSLPLWVATLVLSGILLCSCASQRNTMIQQGYPPAYADGFSDGCSSGKKAAGSMFDQFKKDVNRFSQDQQYAQGWADGYKECEKEQKALGHRPVKDHAVAVFCIHKTL